MNKPRRFWLMGCAFSAWLSVVSGVALAVAEDVTTAPDKLVEASAKQLLEDISANRDTYRKDPIKLRQAVDKYLLPNFDSEYAARLVLGKNWRTASAQQRKDFVDAFYQSMISNYGHYLIDFTTDRLKIMPYTGKPEDTSATIRTEVRKDDGTKVPVNYTMRKTDKGWKAWDVTIEGISYVKSFRTDFGSEIEEKGLDSVIQRLREGQAPAKPSAAAKKSG
jgi:phospholipid transport system substrate-binding protein